MKKLGEHLAVVVNTATTVAVFTTVQAVRREIKIDFDRAVKGLSEKGKAGDDE